MQDFFPIQVAWDKVYAISVIGQVSTQPNTDVNPEILQRSCNVLKELCSFSLGLAAAGNSLVVYSHPRI
jgi:hypothetical protein